MDTLSVIRAAVCPFERGKEVLERSSGDVLSIRRHNFEQSLCRFPVHILPGMARNAPLLEEQFPLSEQHPMEFRFEHPKCLQNQEVDDVDLKYLARCVQRYVRGNRRD